MLRPLFPRFLAALAILSTVLRAAEPPPIKVGEFASLTGKEAAFGQSSHKGTLLAVEEINAAGGVLGRKIQLITEDNQSKAGESATIAKKLISRDKVVALIGEVASMRSLEAAPIAQQFRIPMISPSSTNPKVTEIGNYVFRVCFIDPFQGVVMAKFARNSLRLKRVAVLTSVSSAYSVGLAKYFKERFTQDGGAIALEQRFTEGDKDFKAQLTAIKAANVDGIFLPGYYTEAALVCKQARDLGLNLPLFGGDGWEAPQLISIGGAAVEGTYYSTHYSPENKSPAVSGFVERFRKRWNNEVPDAMAALGYDAAMVLADAIKRAGTTDSAKLREALAATKNLPGVTGDTTLDAQRNASKAAVVIAVRDGKFKFLETVAP
ncbi:MAG: ABC transporter substrate-binding protein [Opitutaceae bacterium]|jgi:branched-chain amino acid transport system substrate-binding protein|nr:ABC transporter substrate-binding protein [Opitutaceae bacterium]